MSRKRHVLSVMAIFRNEAHVLAEWCQHYISQGAEKIYLINHLSTDNYESEIETYRRDGIVELINVAGEFPQIPAYNSLRHRIRKSSRWLLICDLDEFLYGRKGKTIKTYLQSLPWLVSEIIIPWKNFGSSGHVNHPDGPITKNFIYRQSYHNANQIIGDGGKSKSRVSWCKYIVRTNRIRHLSTHFSSVWYGRVIDYNGNPLINYDGTLPVSERSLENSNLHLNHYQIQSFEYFTNIKLKRPEVNTPHPDELKSLEFFKNNDRNEVLDIELSTAHDLLGLNTIRSSTIAK